MDIDSTQWPAFSRLIDRMLDQPPEQRDPWVRALDGEDAALVPQLLELLRAPNRTRATAWLDTLPKLSDVAAEAGPDPSQLIEQAGDEIGPYRLLRLLGSGGMGSVWYAERTDGLVRRGVALKLPLFAGQSRALAARFAREREIVAGLVHPHIARLYDAGIASSGRGYLALEYVEGKSLDEYCNSNRLDLRTRVALFGQVLSAVQYAHSRLVIHRDLKPSNILVTADGQVRLLDFGVAKLLESEANDEAADLTRIGGLAMTLAYAAPEQIAGLAVTTAADIYSMGVVLYELLVGARPYRPKRDSNAALEEAILLGDIPLPSAVALDEAVVAARATTAARLRRALRGDLDAILLKALGRNPAQRYETAAAFADDLIRYLDRRAVRAHRPSRWYRLHKFVARNWVSVGTGAGVSIALVAAAGVALWQAGEAQRQASIAKLERDRALAAVEHREAVDEFMQALLLEAGRTGKPISITSLIARANELSASEFADNPEARAAVLETVGGFEVDFDAPEKALTTFDEANRILANSGDAGLRARVMCGRAILVGVLGQFDEAQRTLHDVANDARLPQYARADCWGNMANLAIDRHDAAMALDAANQALALWEAAPRRSASKHLQLLLYRSVAESLNGQPGKADAGYAAIMDELRRMRRDRGSLSSEVRNYRRSDAIRSGDLNLALATVDEEIAIVKHDFPDRPLPVLPLYERSRILAWQGYYDQALSGFNQVIELAVSDRAIAQRGLLDSARVLSQLGRNAEAEQRYRSAVAEYGPLHAGLVAPAQLDLASLLIRAQLDLDVSHYVAARQDISSALQIKGAPLFSLAYAHRLRALADLGTQGDFDEALLDARFALDAAERLRGDKPYSFWVGQADLVLGQVLRSRGDGQGAQKAFAEAKDQLLQSVGDEHPDTRQARVLLRTASKEHR